MGGPAIAQKTDSSSDEPMPLSKRIKQLLKEKPTFRAAALVLSILGVLLSVAIVWYAWFRLTPQLWHWGFTPLSWRGLPAAAGLLFLVLLPAYAPAFAVRAPLEILAIYAEAEVAKTTKALDRGSTELAVVEDELRDVDKSGLILLLRYSRVQLEAYYRIGLTQTQRSFRYSVVAMWIGFCVILIGIIVRVLDLKKLGLLPPDNNVTTLVILAGAVIELVSALFLWVYRRSVKQLTYFYDRQMYNHSVFMCHRIAETMKASDDVKKTIVDKMLDKTWVLEQDALPQGTALLSFGAKKAGAKKA